MQYHFKKRDGRRAAVGFGVNGGRFRQRRGERGGGGNDECGEREKLVFMESGGVVRWLGTGLGAACGVRGFWKRSSISLVESFFHGARRNSLQWKRTLITTEPFHMVTESGEEEANITLFPWCMCTSRLVASFPTRGE